MILLQKLRSFIDFLPSQARGGVAVAHDIAMAALSFLLALYLRLGVNPFIHMQAYALPGMMLFTLICATVFSAMRLYRGLWRYASLPDMVAIVKAVTVAVALFSMAMFVLTRLDGLPRSVPFINWLLLIALLAGPRLAYRALKEGRLQIDIGTAELRRIPLLLVGATGNAELFIRDCLRDTRSLYRIVGLLDENPVRKNRALHGIRIYGNTANMRTVIRRLERRGLKPQRIILTDPNWTSDQVKALLLQTEALGLPLGRLPQLEEFKQGVPGKSELRPIVLEDLLGRAQYAHDRAALDALVRGKRVAITGAGGSIGAELVRQVAALAPASVLLIDLSEHFLYLIDRELSETMPTLSCRAVIADVRDDTHLCALFAEYKPQIVFHAAAIKHVPLSESNPLAAISTNVLGSRNVARAAQNVGAEAMVMISTDKAVRPTNIMGATKRLAETWCQALGQSAKEGTRFFTVRFGNVLGSHGSVVPLFEHQIRAGGPITVTHPDMVRYFMTIREAVELVMHAAALGVQEARREAIFVLDMGKPVRIVELATQMIRLAGLIPGKDIEIKFSGLRPGEKLFEELFYDEEHIKRTALGGVLVAAPRECVLTPLEQSLALMEKYCKDGNPAAIGVLQQLVPEFQRNPDANEAVSSAQSVRGLRSL